MKYPALLVSMTLVSCAHFSEAPKVVTLPYAPELLESIQKSNMSRKPAMSAASLEGKSPRRVYFSSLYYQYLTLSQYLHDDAKIEFCPAFHHDKIETDSRQVPQVALYKASNIDQTGKAYFPELVFNRKFSLKDHHVSIREELEVLCERGESDNYYKFDNLVSYYAGKKDFHSRPGAMASVLKIPVFANYYLMKMLEAGHSVTSAPEELRFIELTQTHWFGQYVASAHEKRDTFIKNKLVHR